LFRAGDSLENFACRLGLDEGFGIGIVVLQVIHNGVLELGDALEGPAANAVSGDLGEEALDHVEPGSRGRREVEVETRMGLEPGRGFMGGVVVNHEMKVETLWGLLIDQLEKAQELAMPMARQAVPMTLPSSMLSAANKVVVPLRL